MGHYAVKVIHSGGGPCNHGQGWRRLPLKQGRRPHVRFCYGLTSVYVTDAMPVEIVQFCWKFNLERLQKLPEVAGSTAKLRMAGDKPYVTDNSNYIVDLYFDTPIKDSYAAATAISKLVGVVDHGLFLDMVDVCIVANANGVEVKERPK